MTLATDIATTITSVTDSGPTVRGIANAQTSKLSQTASVTIKSDLEWNIKTILFLSQAGPPVKIAKCGYLGFKLQLDKVTTLGIGTNSSDNSTQQLIDFWY